MVPEPAPATARRHSSEVVDAIRAAWPKSGTGELVAIWHDLDHPARVHVVHLGPPLGAAGVELLAHAIVGVDRLEFEEDALLPVEAPRTDGLKWLPHAVDLVARTRRAPGVQLCVVVPEEPAALPRQPRVTTDVSPIRATIEAMFPDATDRVVVRGDTWRIVPQRAACEKAAPP